jgi:hypothetical protein
MNKMEKLKKELIKITYFDINCMCKYPITTIKTVSTKFSILVLIVIVSLTIELSHYMELV